MGLFDFFKKKQPASTPNFDDVPLEQSCYDIAYFILPQYVFQDLKKIRDLCARTPEAAGPFYYIMACQAREIEPDMDVASTFQWHKGTFDDGRKFLALEYPTPPPVDMEDTDPIEMLESGANMVLAPYFSVILYGRHVDSEYFILGQAPLGGRTTVRQILEGGVNCNLGPGPSPNLGKFLKAIRELRSDGKD